MPRLTKITRRLLCGLFALWAVSTSATAEETAPLKIYDNWGGNFTLTDQHGIPMSLSDFKGKVLLLTFGYTHCPDICPTTMFTLKRAVNALGDDADKVQVIFITVDPERDDAARLGAYMDYFNPGFVALRGTVDEVTQVAKQYGTRFQKEDYDAEGNYSIAHTSVIYLLDQAGRIRVFFKITASPDRIAADMRRLLAGE